MNEKLKIILIIVGISILFAGGIMAIIIPCIINTNWYSLFSIFLFALAMSFPVMCNVHESGNTFSLDEDQEHMGPLLAWFLVGACLTIAYSIPFLLWHKQVMDLVNMICTMSGGTVMILALGLFGYFILFKKSDVGGFFEY